MSCGSSAVIPRPFIRIAPVLAVGVCVSSTHALTGTISCFGSSAASRICLSLLWKVVLAIPFSSHHALIVFPLSRYSRYISAHASSLTRFFASLILLSSINSHLVQPSPGTFWDFVALYGYCSTFRVICIAVGLVGGYVYSENLYLSPVMFLEYFRLYDYFQGLCDANSYTHSPFSPELRERLIIESYFEDIPESFNTDEGNDLLNNFLDAVDMLEEQLKIKFNNGKLDLIINKH